MLVREIMTINPVYARPDTTLREVARLMAEHSCGGIPVCDDRGVIGLITERDMACRGFTQGLNPLEIPARYVMTARVVSISENETLDRAVQVMSDAGVGRLPVLRNGRLIGIVSSSDIVEHVPDQKAAQLARRSSHTHRLSVD